MLKRLRSRLKAEEQLDVEGVSQRSYSRLPQCVGRPPVRPSIYTRPLNTENRAQLRARLLLERQVATTDHWEESPGPRRARGRAVHVSGNVKLISAFIISNSPKS